MEICLTLGFVIVVIAIVVAASNASAKEKARLAYHSKLAQLRLDPTNAGQREAALRLGRQYSNLTRNSQGVTVYDEMAIKNDIDAACAGAVAQVQRVPIPIVAPQAQVSHAERLRKLQEILDCGLITQDEYQQRREKILDEV